MSLSTIPRVRFAHLPTPVEPLPRLSAALGGPPLWIKRDDQTGLAFGGNKTRKLEFLLAEAQAHGADTLITRGAQQSNHCRQTAAAARRLGLECILVLTGEPAQTSGGNFLLDQLLGAECVWTHAQDPDTVLQATFEDTWQAGRRPYLIPYGGSNVIGAAAYAAAISEFLTQGVPVDRIVLATSSGGTQAGMLAGAALFGYQGLVHGISVDPTAERIVPYISQLAMDTAEFLGGTLNLPEGDVIVEDAYLGGGYGVVGELERTAIHTFAQQEGILLDPVYTGRAGGALIDLIRKGVIDAGERVLFWHTGGTPALFAYSEQLL